MNELAEQPAIPTIASELNTFLLHVSGLSSTLPLVMHSISTASRKAVKKYDFFEKEEIIRETPDGRPGFLVNIKYYQEFEKWDKSMKGLTIAYKVIPRSFLVSLISQYDAFLGGLIRAIYYIKPELLNTSERNLSFSQLVRFNSIAEAREHIIEKEVEAVLRKSHSEQFSWMETKYDIPLRKGLDIWSDFIEITERRNLFVHTSGSVSSQYMSVCNEHGVKLATDIRVGTELELEPAYLRHAFNVLFEIAVKLAHVLWRKFQPDEREKADMNLNEICYDLLMEKRYKLAQRLLDFATVTIKKHSTDDIRRMLVINRVLAYKWGGEEKTATSILKDEDWSATASKYKLAETVLRGDFEAAARMMKKIGKDDEEINVASYKLWPLFRDFRDSPIFLQAFEEVFGLPFNVIDSPTDTVHELENKLATLEETIEEDSTLLDDTETSSDVVDKD